MGQAGAVLRDLATCEMGVNCAAMQQTERVAVVTGANRGIGLAIARELVSQGFRVLATSRDEEAGRAAAREIGAAYHALDVTSPESIEALAQDLASGASQPEGFDVLVNNAGIALDGFDEKVARKTLDVNFFGPMRVTDRLLPLARKGARIVMVSSGLGAVSALSPALRDRFLDETIDRERLVALVEAFVRDVAEGEHAARGWPTSAYSVSKIALNTLTRILARELAGDPRSILVNAACPGWVRTRMGGAGAPRSPEDGARTPVWLALLPPSGPSGGFFRDERRVPW
jgi:carbonyl reductase 1